MKTQRCRILFAALFLIICTPLTVFAIRAAAGPSDRNGGYYHTLVDRLDITVDYTQFTLKKSGKDAQTFEIPFTLTVKKCEPDFYAVLDDVEIEGLAYASADFICTTQTPDTAAPFDLPLPVSGNEPLPLIWNVTLRANFTEKGDYEAALRISYTTGLTQETADARLTTIPLLIHVV